MAQGIVYWNVGNLECDSKGQIFEGFNTLKNQRYINATFYLEASSRQYTYNVPFLNSKFRFLIS